MRWERYGEGERGGGGAEPVEVGEASRERVALLEEVLVARRVLLAASREGGEGGDLVGSRRTAVMLTVRSQQACRACMCKRQWTKWDHSESSEEQLFLVY